MPIAWISLVATLAAAPRTPAPDVVPLRKLRLYETGVGYFERRGGVSPGRKLALPLPTSHLDDALKTLVILDVSGDTRVQGVEFASAISESGARAMAGLPATAEESLAYVDVLASLEGSEVEVEHAGGRVRGHMLDVEGPFHPPPRPDASEPTPQDVEGWHAIVIVDGDGRVQRIRTTDIESVQAVDDATQTRLRVAAESLSHHSARRPHPLELRVSSTGQVGLGYIAEAPVWRTTYRLVLADEGRDAELQAWALVHNDTDEDWRDVALELANGQPQSFLYPLAAPRYAWRELAGPEQALSTVPQLAETTPDRLWGDHIGDAYGTGGLGLTGTGYGGGGSGEGTIGLGNVGLIGHGGGGGTAGGPAIGDLAELSKAQGQESGALFVYRIDDPLDLQAHHSALVPILQRTIEAESITWFPGEQDDGLSGARVVNSTDQTLPAGVASFFAGGGFVGETALDRLKPKERQFVVFGTEQDVSLDRDETDLDSRTVDVQWRDDVLIDLREDRSRLRLALDNRSGRPRRVYVALPIPRNAGIEADVELDFDEETGWPLAVTSVGAGAQVVHEMTVTRGSTRRVDPRDVAELRTLASAPALPQEDREAIGRAIEHRIAAQRALAEAEELRHRLQRSEAEVERLRRDLDALGKARLRGRFAKQIARDLLAAERGAEDDRDALRQTEAVARREHRAAHGILKAI